jgi:hypothetical protein
LSNWPWRKIFFAIGCLLMLIGCLPLAALLWHGYAHNFQPLSMKLPSEPGTFTSTAFKTDLDGSYMVQVDLMDAQHRSSGLNPDAVLDLDWKIVDLNGAVIAQGSQNAVISLANNMNLGQYRPRRGLRQRMVVNIHREITEPPGTMVMLEVNSVEDPEGAAFGFVVLSLWAAIVGGLGAVILLVVLGLWASHRAAAETSSRIQRTP